jgi:hypothetical protein
LGRIKTGSRKLKKNIRLAEVLRPLGGGSESNELIKLAKLFALKKTKQFTWFFAIRPSSVFCLFVGGLPIRVFPLR